MNGSLWPTPNWDKMFIVYGRSIVRFCNEIDLMLYHVLQRSYLVSGSCHYMDVTLYITSSRYSYSKDDWSVTYSCCNEFTRTDSDMVKLHVMMSCMCVLMCSVGSMSFITVKLLWYSGLGAWVLYQQPWVYILPRNHYFSEIRQMPAKRQNCWLW